jgi:hypothetical protein
LKLFLQIVLSQLNMVSHSDLRLLSLKPLRPDYTHIERAYFSDPKNIAIILRLHNRDPIADKYLRVFFYAHWNVREVQNLFWTIPSFVLAAVQQDGRALEFASDERKADRAVVLAAVQQDGRALEFAAPALQAEYGIVLAAVQQDGMALKYAAPALQAEYGIVLAAVTQCGLALEFASEELMENHEITSTATAQTFQAFQFVAFEIMLRAVQHDLAVLAYSSKEFVMYIVQQNGLALQYAADALKADYDIVLAAVQQDGRALEFASDELKADREIVLAAVAEHRGALEFAAHALQADSEIVDISVSDVEGFALVSRDALPPAQPHGRPSVHRKLTWQDYILM